jgi:hypothetical protein
MLITNFNIGTTAVVGLTQLQMQVAVPETREGRQAAGLPSPPALRLLRTVGKGAASLDLLKGLVDGLGDVSFKVVNKKKDAMESCYDITAKSPVIVSWRISQGIGQDLLEEVVLVCQCVETTFGADVEPTVILAHADDNK